MKFDLFLQFIVQVFQYLEINIRAKMAHRSIQKMQVILQAQSLKLRICGGIQFCFIAAVRYIDAVHILHQFYRLLLADILIERPAEFICNIVFSVGKSACSAETVHDRTGFAADAAFYLIAVDRTFPLIQ